MPFAHHQMIENLIESLDYQQLLDIRNAIDNHLASVKLYTIYRGRRIVSPHLCNIDLATAMRELARLDGSDDPRKKYRDTTYRMQPTAWPDGTPIETKTPVKRRVVRVEQSRYHLAVV